MLSDRLLGLVIGIAFDFVDLMASEKLMSPKIFIGWTLFFSLADSGPDAPPESFGLNAGASGRNEGREAEKLNSLEGTVVVTEAFGMNSGAATFHLLG